jgi:hypothetical protein
MILIGIVVLAIFSQKDEELDSDEIFSHYEKVGWSRFTEDLGSKKITQIIVYSDVGLLLAFTTDQKYYRTDDLLDTLNDEEQALLDDVEDVMHLSATEMSEAPSGSDAVGNLLKYILIIGVALWAMIFFLKKFGGRGMDNVLSLRHSKARFFTDYQTVKFSDVGGCEDAKEELGDVVDFLSNPDRWVDAYSIQKYCVATLLIVSATSSYAGIVDFESIPTGSLSEGLTISNQYLASQGMSFRLKGGGTPTLVQRGDQGIGAAAFVSSSKNVADSLNDENVGGQFFLADDLTNGNIPPTLIIDLNDPMANFSMSIYDIESRADGTYEAWRLSFYDLSDNLINFMDIDVNSPMASDGVATPVSFGTVGAMMSRVELEYTGTAVAPGIGWDDFATSAVAVPEPGSMVLLSCLAGFWRIRRRKQSVAS